MQKNYYVDLELHNKEPEPTYRNYEILFEDINNHTSNLSIEAYQELSCKFSIRLKNIKNPIFINDYLFTTITPEKDYIRYFYVKYKESRKAHPLSLIVQDCINQNGLAGAQVYTLHRFSDYTPLHDLYFKSLNVNLDVCFQIYLKDQQQQYLSFESIFTDEYFEDNVTQYCLLEY